MKKNIRIFALFAIFSASALTAYLIMGPKTIDELKHSVEPTASLYPAAKPMADVMNMVDDNNEALPLSEATNGKWALLYFGYASCPDTCPMDLSKISQTIHKMEKAKELQVVFVSVDPSRDIGKMSSFVKGFHKDFVGLSSTEENIVTISKKLGVYHQVAVAKQLAEQHSDGEHSHDMDSHDGHDMDSHDGHDMDSHDGHDMDSHDGHSPKANDQYLIDHTTSYLLLNPELELVALLSSPHKPNAMAKALDEIITALR